MLLSKLKLVYDCVDKINPTIKTFIIIVLFGLVYATSMQLHANEILQDYTESAHVEKLTAEEYTEMIAPIINNYVYDILVRDSDASNVLLMNYHNTLVSSNGLSYRYFTAVTEKRRDITTRKVIRIWKELEYIDYGDEIMKINSRQFLYINNTDSCWQEFPNLLDLLKSSGAKSAMFCPVVGIDGNIGMIVILYHKHRDYKPGYYGQVIANKIQPLAALLDYNNIQKVFKNTPRDKFKQVFREKYESRQDE